MTAIALDSRLVQDESWYVWCFQPWRECGREDLVVFVATVALVAMGIC